MTDSVLERFAGRKLDERTALPPEPEPEAFDDLGAFGWLRGMRDKALMLELRQKSGAIKAIGYAWLHEVLFDPAEGITLLVPGQKIRLIGRNLNAEQRPNIRLFRGLTRHRVPWIQEADEPARLRAGEGETVIERIEW